MVEDKGLWAALNRRKVFRTLGIYLAGAWLVLQIGNLIVDIWQLPGWTVQGLFILLVIGLPVTAVLAWRYDITEHGPVVSKGAGLREILARQNRLGRAGITLITLLLTLVVFVGMLHLWPDAELDPRLRHMLSTPVVSGSNPDNAAYLLYGFDAPAGRDPYQYGRFIIDTYETMGVIPDNPEPLKFTLDQSDRWGLTHKSATGYFADIDNVPTILAANRELMDRYRQLRQAPVFTEVIRPTFDSPVASIRPLLIAEHLMRRQIAYDCVRGNIQSAWGEWRTELTVRRSLLASANTILMKSIAATLVGEIDRLRILLLIRCPSEFAGPPVKRLSLPERSLVSPLRFEFIGSLNSLLDNRDRSAFASGFKNTATRFMYSILPFRRNATANYATVWLKIVDASLLDTKGVIEWSGKVRPFTPSFLEYLNNGAGLMLVHNTSDINWVQYIYRLHDLDRLILLSQAAERLLKAGVDAEQANGWLTALPDSFRDPFTGKRPVLSDGILSYPTPDIDYKFMRGLDLPLL